MKMIEVGGDQERQLAKRLGMDGAYFRVHHFAATGITVSATRGGWS